MNKFRGKILELNTAGKFSQVTLEVTKKTFVSIVIASPYINPNLKIGNFVDFAFKETDVTICKSIPDLISITNQIPVRIIKNEPGILLACLQLDFGGHLVNAVVPSNFAKQLMIKEEVVMLIRSNDIMLME